MNLQAEALKADMTDSKLGPADIWTSRQALQDLYQKMLVTDLEYALDKKVEQDLWNHAFKNQITTLQSQAKNRGNPNRSEVQANLSLFLEAASGFYTQELCTVFNVDLPCRVKSSRLGIISNKQNNTSAIVKPQPSSCSYICQHCLVHLGDIARYRNQTSQAESYYRHAAQLVPSNGQPYNQLAILASSKGDHLTTIFYYCRSIAVKFPFPAASTNLQKALSKALESRDEVKTKWSVSDFIKAFIKFHGHVYLSRSLEKLSSLREKLEEQFQRLILQKAFSSQQLVHITVINLFELHHLRDYSSEADEQNFSPDEQISWIQLLALFMSFLGIMCSRALLSKNHEEVLGECPLPAIKVSLDWLKLRPRVFNESAVDKRQYVWSWLVAILNSFQPREDDVTCTPVMPLPEEFELQGFLALRPALRALDFSKGHQGIIGDKGLPTRARHQRLISLGKWVADNQPRLIQYRIEDGVLQFITDIPQMIIEEPQDKDGLVLQESSNSDPPSSEGSMGLKSVLSVGKSHGGGPEGGERPVVTFKENIKPREHSRELARNLHQKEGSKDRRDYSKGNGTPCKNEQKKDNKRKNESKKNSHEKTPDSGKQAKGQSEMTKVPVSESRKTPVTQTQTTSSSQFIPIHHPGAFPPLPSRPGFPPPAYVIPPPVAFSMNPGFTFSTGYMQVSEQSGQLWNQHQPQPSLQKMPLPVKQPFFMSPQDPMKLFEHQVQAVPMQPPQSISTDKKVKYPEVKAQDFYWESPYRMADNQPMMSHQVTNERLIKRQPVFCPEKDCVPRLSSFEENSYQNSSIFSEAYGKNMTPNPKPDIPLAHQEASLYSLFEGTPWSPSLPASSDHSTPASQSPHSSNPSSLPSSPPTHSHGSIPFSNFGPIGTSDSRDRRMTDRWKAEKTVGGFGLDYLPAVSSSENSWHQASAPSSTWAAQESPMEDSSTVLLDSLKSIWSSSMMHPGPSALEQLLMQQKQKQQRGHGTMNPPH
ncbi:protein SMG7-like [Scleropages formosus]|uniref:Nonsense-mediated mRNA decay factor n=1 Tax=Scleropages formosus TaxID=113540 RepID=A0A0P7XH60_SCLFO|nr:protein SMG7-like [Scleropages formosus]